MTPGPQKTATEALAKRGTRRGKQRAAQANGNTPKSRTIAPFVRPRARPISDADLDRVIQLLPGYDPLAQSEGFTFDYKAARKAIAFFETELVHIKGVRAGKPFLLEPWQRGLIGCLFGWKDANGLRRYRETFLFVARKNGKTCLAAGLIVYLLFEDAEPGSEIYGCASEYSQASLVFHHARGMVARNPSLAARSKTYTGQARSIQLSEEEGWSTYRVGTSKPGSLHGANSAAYVIDELHALPDSELVDVLETSTGAREQPLAILISTSDYEREGSPCNAKHDYACKVRDGIIDDSTFLPVVFEASIEDDWTAPEVWRKANPNLGVSLSEQYLLGQCKKAQESPRFENTFKRLHLNIRTAQDVRWIPMDRWDACAGDPIDLADYRDRECWGGLDLATSRDLTALILCFPEADESLTLVPLFWIPKDTALERSKKDRIPYLSWIKQGLIRTTPGAVTDYATVRRDINELISEHGIMIRGLALDRLFQGAQLGTELSEQDGLNVCAFGMGFLSMAAPTAGFEELVLQGRLHHGGDPVLRWHASNVSVEMDAAGNLKPSRKKSSEKIDGIVAAIMATALTLSRKQTRSVYEDRGLVYV